MGGGGIFRVCVGVWGFRFKGQGRVQRGQRGKGDEKGAKGRKEELRK